MLEKVEINLELDLKLDVQKTMHSLYFNQIDFYCGTNQKYVLKFFCFFYLFEDKQFFLFLCLGTSKILSLGEFDELKSHLFLVHFFA